MSLGAELVTAVLDTGELQPLLDAGFTRDWLNTPDSGSYAVFGGEDYEAYKYVLDHWDKHGRVITRRLFGHNFPTYNHGEDTEATVAELLEPARREARKAVLEQLLGDASDLVEQDRIDSALDRLTTRVTAISSPLMRNRLQILNNTQLDQLPDPEPQIEGFIDRGTINTLYGRWGTAKSFLALDWALCIASGQPWLGHDVLQGRVLYVAAEGGIGQRRRIKAWKKRYGKGSKLDDIQFIIEPIQLHQENHLTQLVKAIREIDVDLLILDTQAQTTVGMDENASQDMGQVLSAWMRLRDATEPAHTTVLNIHHENKTGTDRGSSALAGGVDSLYRMRRPKHAEEFDPITDLDMELVCLKRKDAEPPPMMTLRLEAEKPSLVITDGSGPSQLGRPSKLAEVMKMLEKDGMTKTQLIGSAVVSRPTLDKHLDTLYARFGMQHFVDRWGQQKAESIFMTQMKREQKRTGKPAVGGNRHLVPAPAKRR